MWYTKFWKRQAPPIIVNLRRYGFACLYLNPKKYTYEQIKDFAELIFILKNEQLPKTTSMERSLDKRGNKIYLDHLKNRKGQTIAVAYSLRCSGSTESAPLH
jgi:DNA primase